MISRSSSQKLAAWYARIALLVSCLYFAQVYVTYEPSYMKLPDYARGLERMPFQGRDLMRWLLLLASRSTALARLTAGHKLLNSPELLVVQLTACASLLLAGWAATKLYRLLQPDGRARLLPWAITVVLCLFDFVLTVPYSFPYDLPAMAFLAWGTYFVFAEQFLWLLLLFVPATFNRETTLFLILLLLVSSSVRDGRVHWKHLQASKLGQVAVLSAMWVGIRALQAHRYAANATEAGPRISVNLHALSNPLLWPNILSASAFLLPWIFLSRERLPDARLRAALLILPFWLLLLLSVGQILELRIYGDISVFVAVTATILLEQTLRRSCAEASLVP